MTTFPASAASEMGTIIVNPGMGTASAGFYETSLRDVGWWVLDLSGFMAGFPDHRGENLVIPGEDGRRAYPEVLDQGTYVAELRMGGGACPTGTHSDKLMGLVKNKRWLRDNVTNPPPNGNATRTVRVVYPDATTAAGEVQFRIAAGEQKGDRLKAALTMIVPRGGLA